MAKKKSKSTFQVKLKVSITGYKNKFYEGIALAYSKEQAEQLSINFLTENINKNIPDELRGLVTISSIKADRIKDQFLVNADKAST